MAFGDRCWVLKLWVLKAWNFWELAELEAEVELSWLPDEPAAHIVSSCWKLPPWILSFSEQLSSTSSMQRSSLLISSSFKSLRLDETMRRCRVDIELPPVSIKWLASAFKDATYGSSGSLGQVALSLYDWSWSSCGCYYIFLLIITNFILNKCIGWTIKIFKLFKFKSQLITRLYVNIDWRNKNRFACNRESQHDFV